MAASGGAGRAGGDLGAILRGYRRACALTQQQLADTLGYDRTYISMIESGRRHLTDRGTLAHIARTLAIPPHLLGIAGPDDADFAAMLAFGISVIRLAQIARQSGRAAEAVSELWPLITRLEARAAYLLSVFAPILGDPDLARDLAGAAALNPRSTWCATVTDHQAHAIGHGCARPAPDDHGKGRAEPGGSSGPDPPGRPSFTLTTAGQPGPPGGYGTWRFSAGIPGQRDWLLQVRPIPTDGCDHRHQAKGHDPVRTG